MTFTCERCGATSKSGLASFQERYWRSWHDATCIGESTRATAPVDWTVADAVVARARARKPLDPRMNGSALLVRGEPRRLDLDNWGRSRGGGVRWASTNCLRACIANLLGAADLKRVPDPTPLFTSSEDWLSDYSDQLAKQTGYRLEQEPAHVCLDIRNDGRRWIACIEEDGPANHAVVARGGLVFHDPAGRYGALPRDRVMFGMRLVPRGAPKLDRWGRSLR